MNPLAALAPLALALGSTACAASGLPLHAPDPAAQPYATAQRSPGMLSDPVERDDLALVQVPGGDLVHTRSIPFQIARQHRLGEEGAIPIGARAETLLLAGLVNYHWDVAVAHWGEHPETWTERPDQVHPGVEIGRIAVHYEDGEVDEIPLVMGATAWFVTIWAMGPPHLSPRTNREPFDTRPEFAQVLEDSFLIREGVFPATAETLHHHYLLAVEPRPKKIDRLVVHNNESKRGAPLVSGVTLVGPRDFGPNIQPLGPVVVDAGDIAPAFSTAAIPDLQARAAAMARILHTTDADLPQAVEPLEFRPDIDAATLRFHSAPGAGGFDLAGMLGNYWVANLESFHTRFHDDTGGFHESEPGAPWYGGYNGMGSWERIGVYHGNSYARCADHFATGVLRALANRDRVDNWIDYIDDWLTFFRPDNDPANGIANDGLDASRWPADAPGVWSFMMEHPLAPPWEMNELQGTQELDGHGSTTIGRWWAWRLAGGPVDEWLTAPRAHRYGLSRWDSQRDAAEFICWLMDYTGRDAIFSEGESTSWGGGPPGTPQNPEGWATETDMEVIRGYYRDFEVYFQSYPTWTCAIALMASAQMGDAAGQDAYAERWRAYAARIRAAMLDEMAVGEPGAETWKYAGHSVFPSHNEALVQAFLAAYIEGYDHNDWDPDLLPITRRTLRERIERPNMGRAVIGLGYGQGWLLHSTLAMDEMDAAANAIRDLARFAWDKNMDYQDPERGIDWRRWQWIFPEGVNALPDGSWHRIGDLGNGANAGPPIQAMLFAAGVDDTRPGRIRVLPRVLDPMDGMTLGNLQTVVADGAGGLAVARVGYDYRLGQHFRLSSDLPLPGLEVRLGPFASESEAASAIAGGLPAGATTRPVQSGIWRGGDAWWLWVEGLGDRAALELDLSQGQ